MKTNKSISIFVVVLSLSTALPLRVSAQTADEKEKAKQQPQQDREKARLERESERAYQQAKKLVDKGQWEEALKSLDDAIKKGGSRVDGALYWLAYAQSKLNQRAEALSTLAWLNKTFADIRWLNDA